MIKFRWFLFFLCISICISQAQSLYPIGNGLIDTENNFGFRSPHVEKYNGVYFIAGQFDLADTLAVKNLCIWDGEKYLGSPEIGFNDPVLDLFQFQDSLYAKVRTEGTQDQYYYSWNSQDQNWNLSFTITEGYSYDVHIHQNELYLFGNKKMEMVEHGLKGPLLKFDGDTWTQISIDWPDDEENIYSVCSKEDSLVFIFEADEFDNLGPLVIQPNEGGSLRMLGTKDMDHRDRIYNYKGNIFFGDYFNWEDTKLFVLDKSNWHLIYTPPLDDAITHFTQFNNQLYFGTTNEGSYVFNELDSFHVFSKNYQFGIFDVEQVSEKEFLLVGRFGYYGDTTKLLNDIALLEFDESQITLKSSSTSICENEYIFNHALTSDATMDFSWSLEGAIPNTMEGAYATVKYANPGEYPVTLICSNDFGQQDTLYTSIEVTSGCAEQREKMFDNIWMMGFHHSFPQTVAGLDFSNGDPIPCAFHTQLDYDIGSLTQCNANGKLLFYSNGKSLENFNHKVLDGSVDFNLGEWFEYYDYEEFASPNNMMYSIPDEGEEDVYHVFHAPLDRIDLQYANPKTIAMSSIKFSEEYPEGQMILKNLPIAQDTFGIYTMQMQKHCNDEDWWIIMSKAFSSEYYSILYKKDGTIISQKLDHGIYLDFGTAQTVFSKNGRKLAMANTQNEESYVWDFDPCEGVLSNVTVIKPEKLDEYDQPRGVCFSPNSRFLYVSSFLQLRQYDLCRENIDSSEILIDQVDDFIDWIYPVSFAKQALGPNNKIYVASLAGSNYMGVINNPNLSGLACNFVQRQLKAPDLNKFSRRTLPDFPHFRPDFSLFNCDSLILSIEEAQFEIHKPKIYPNPARNGFNVELYEGIANMKEVSIFNQTGQALFSQSIKNGENQLFINTQDLKPGIYYIKTSLDSNEYFFSKVVILE